MTTAIDGHLSLLGWSPTNPRMVTHQKEVYYRHGIWQLHITHKTNTRWQLPWMVPYHSCEGHPQTQGWSATIRKRTTDMEFGNNTLIIKLTPGDNCPEGLLTIRRRITCQRKDGHPPTNGWSPQLALLGLVWHHLARVCASGGKFWRNRWTRGPKNKRTSNLSLKG